MGLFGKILGNKKSKAPRGFETLTIKNIVSVGKDCVKVTLDIPSELKSNYTFTPGQYIVISVTVAGKTHRRSYSICSSTGEDLAFAAKQIENGVVSTWLNNELKEGDEIHVSAPEGSFTLPGDAKNVVLIAAGSGITPMLSMIGSESDKQFRLFYGNRTQGDILFKSQLDQSKCDVHYYLSQEKLEGYGSGRINKENFTDVIKSDLGILKSDAFMLCGPEEMINDLSETLYAFGVSKEKIHFELFTPPTATETNEADDASSFTGTAKVNVILDGDSEEIEVSSKEFILDKAIDEGIDAPYSCKGGVCSSCKAKILKGSVKMKLNYSLTDKDIEEGYVLSCQSMPTSEEITISYDA